MTRSFLALTLALSLSSILIGCPATTPTLAACATPGCEPDPVIAVERYRDLLVASRPRDAFTWLHPDATEGLDADAFALLFERHADALIAQAEELLVQARAAAPTLFARVRTDHGEVVVERTAEGWRLRNPVPSAPTP
jgi:hypothetical protein